MVLGSWDLRAKDNIEQLIAKIRVTMFFKDPSPFADLIVVLNDVMRNPSWRVPGRVGCVTCVKDSAVAHALCGSLLRVSSGPGAIARLKIKGLPASGRLIIK